MKQLRQHSSTFIVIGFLLVQAALLVWTTRGTFGVDFAAYYLAGRALQQGRNIYTLTDADWNALAAEANVPEVAPPYRYPPLLVGALRPIVLLPYKTALLIWRVLTIVALLITSVCLSQLLRQHWIDPLVFAAAAFFVPAITTLYAGQANTWVLVALALYFLFDQRRHPWLAGAALAFSLLIKPLAVALAAYLAWRREWRRLTALLVGIAVWIVVMVILTGPAANLAYLHSIIDLTPGSPSPYPPNQSVFGFWWRLLTANEYAPALVNSSSVANILSLFTAGVLGLIAAYLTWSHREDTFVPGAGLVMVTFSLIVPVSWYHHFTIDLIPLLVAWYAATRRHLRILLLLAFGLLAVQGLAWKAFIGQTLLLSLGMYGLLLIDAVTAIALWPRPAVKE